MITIPLLLWGANTDRLPHGTHISRPFRRGGRLTGCQSGGGDDWLCFAKKWRRRSDLPKIRLRRTGVWSSVVLIHPEWVGHRNFKGCFWHVVTTHNREEFSAYSSFLRSALITTAGKSVPAWNDVDNVAEVGCGYLNYLWWNGSWECGLWGS